MCDIRPRSIIEEPYTSRSGYRGSTDSLLDYLTRELHKYRAAVSRMGQDIVTLTDEIRELDAENESLRGGGGQGQLGPNQHSVVDEEGNEYVGKT